MHFVLRSSVGLHRIAQKVIRNGREVRNIGGPVMVNSDAATPFTTNLSRFYSDQPAKPDARNRPKPGDKPQKITLHGVDGSISITSLEEAQKISKRRGLKLVKEPDGKTRPEYKLITIAKIKQEELDTNNEKTKGQSSKGDKMLSLNNKIADHDLQSRLKHMEKWLSKQHKIIVVISGSVSDLSVSEKIFKRMEEATSGLGRIIQKRTKGSEIRFQIQPTTTNASAPPPAPEKSA